MERLAGGWFQDTDIVVADNPVSWYKNIIRMQGIINIYLILMIIFYMFLRLLQMSIYKYI